MTKYFYKNKEISHLDFLSLMKRAGLESGYRVSHYEHLKELASQGNTRAKDILDNLDVQKN